MMQQTYLYLERNLRIILEPEEDGFVVYCPSLPGCVSQGDTEQEAIENIVDAIEAVCSALEEKYGQEVLHEEYNLTRPREWSAFPAEISQTATLVA